MAPTYAVPRLLARNGLSLQDFDFYEIHEAFASVVLAHLQAWESEDYCKERLGLDAALGSIDRSKLNVNGSSLAAGHPFAATGGRILAQAAKQLAQKRAEHKGGAGKPLRALDLHLRRRWPGRGRDPGGLNRPLSRRRRRCGFHDIGHSWLAIPGGGVSDWPDDPVLWSDPPTPTAIRGIPETTACQRGRAYEKGRRWSEGIQRRPFCIRFGTRPRRKIPRFTRGSGGFRVA